MGARISTRIWWWKSQAKNRTMISSFDTVREVQYIKELAPEPNFPQDPRIRAPWLFSRLKYSDNYTYEQLWNLKIFPFVSTRCICVFSIIILSVGIMNNFHFRSSLSVCCIDTISKLDMLSNCVPSETLQDIDTVSKLDMLSNCVPSETLQDVHRQLFIGYVACSGYSCNHYQGDIRAHKVILLSWHGIYTAYS
jgi:hypothetical protein